MTAEFAVAMVAVMTMLLVVLAAAVVGSAQVRAQLAAGAGARAAARGESPAVVADTVRGLAGSEATVVSSGPEASAESAESATSGSSTGAPVLVEITVSRPVTVLLPGAGRLVVRARAGALAEGSGPPGESAPLDEWAAPGP